MKREVLFVILNFLTMPFNIFLMFNVEQLSLAMCPPDVLGLQILESPVGMATGKDSAIRG